MDNCNKSIIKILYYNKKNNEKNTVNTIILLKKAQRILDKCQMTGYNNGYRFSIIKDKMKFCNKAPIYQDLIFLY